jgi:single-stranded-DNA-specific exonuclease
MKLPKSTSMDNILQKAANLVKKNKDKTIHIVSHIDADGLAAASIISKALDREGITHTVTCIKLDQLPDVNPADIIIFSDLGSSQLTWLSHLDDTPKIILDHHPPLQKTCPNLIHVNPYFSSINGSSEISGAGVSYLFAKTLNPSNIDLSPLAVVGACGDMQDFGKLTGLNRNILEDGHAQGLIQYEDDLLLYGRFTRPLFKSLQYFSDPYIPGISGDEYACKTLLKDLNIKTRDTQWVTLSHLSFEEKRILATELVTRSIKSAPPGLGKYIPKMIIGETYSLPQEEIRSPLRDCNEFATCLNACGRRNRVDVGIEVAKGNRGVYYQMLLEALQDHRASIAQALDILSQKPVTLINQLQIMDASGVSDIIAGTCAQMLLGQNGINPYNPLMVYTPSDRDSTILKVSARCSRLLLYKNIHLGKAISKAAATVSGEGGGHAPACGAYIPQRKLKEFTKLFAALVSAQLT